MPWLPCVVCGLPTGQAWVDALFTLVIDAHGRLFRYMEPREEEAERKRLEAKLANQYISPYSSLASAPERPAPYVVPYTETPMWLHTSCARALSNRDPTVSGLSDEGKASLRAGTALVRLGLVAPAPGAWMPSRERFTLPIVDAVPGYPERFWMAMPDGLQPFEAWNHEERVRGREEMRGRRSTAKASRKRFGK